MPTHFQTVFLLVCHGATVLTRPFPELNDILRFINTFLVPVLDGVEVSLPLWLRLLMGEGGSGGGEERGGEKGGEGGGRRGGGEEEGDNK